MKKGFKSRCSLTQANRILRKKETKQGEVFKISTMLKKNELYLMGKMYCAFNVFFGFAFF